MRIYLVRHGETDWNLEMRIQGQIDVPLNVSGINQAKECALFFRQNSFDYVYSSRLKRAIETAEIITSGKLSIRKYQAFNERSFGTWETFLWSEIHQKNPDLREQWKLLGRQYHPPEGESILEMTTRVTRKFREIIDRHLINDSLLIVAHGGPIKVMIGNVMGIDEYVVYNRLEMHNCCINIMEYDGDTFKIERINYVHRPVINH